MAKFDSTGATLFVSVLLASAIGLGVAKWSTKPSAGLDRAAVQPGPAAVLATPAQAQEK